MVQIAKVNITFYAFEKTKEISGYILSDYNECWKEWESCFLVDGNVFFNDVLEWVDAGKSSVGIDEEFGSPKIPDEVEYVLFDRKPDWS